MRMCAKYLYLCVRVYERDRACAMGVTALLINGSARSSTCRLVIPPYAQLKRNAK